MSKMLGVIF